MLSQRLLSKANRFSGVMKLPGFDQQKSMTRINAIARTEFYSASNFPRVSCDYDLLKPQQARSELLQKALNQLPPSSAQGLSKAEFNQHLSLALLNVKFYVESESSHIDAHTIENLKRSLDKIDDFQKKAPLTITLPKESEEEDKSLTTRDKLKYSLDASIIAFGVVSFWRGVWFLWDANVFPDDPLKSGLASLGVGLSVLLYNGAFEVALAPPLTKLKKKNQNQSNEKKNNS